MGPSARTPSTQRPSAPRSHSPGHRTSVTTRSYAYLVRRATYCRAGRRERHCGGGSPGGLHPGSLLVGPSSRLAAVIDFGDVTGGDPATDLAAAWLVFDAEDRAVFVDRFGARVDTDAWRRAEGWALNLGTALACHTDDPALAAVGRRALGQILGGVRAR